MPKKLGVNSKAEAARARKSASESEKKEKAVHDKEEAYWREAEGSKSRAAQKRDEEAAKRAETAARKAEIKKLAELEAAEIEKSGKKPDKKANRVSVPVPKVTGVELERRREEEKERVLKNAEEAKKKEKRMADEEEYERMVLVSNTNRDDSLIEAHSVDEAIAKISISEAPLPADRHPERRLKASFKVGNPNPNNLKFAFCLHALLSLVCLQAFEEVELAKLKEEKPGLTLNQYKDMIWKMWKKSPDNPLNQVII